MRSFGKLGQANVERYLDDMWQSLVDADPKWPGTNQSKFPAGGFGNINSAYGTYDSNDKSSKVFDPLGLDAKVNGHPSTRSPRPAKTPTITPV